MENTEMVKVKAGDLKQLIQDVAQLKAFFIPEKSDPEGELSDWAKNELAEARKEPLSEYISHEEVEKIILGK